MHTKNTQKLMRAFFENLGNSHYYGNYNDWLTKFSDRVSSCRKQRDNAG